MASSRILHVDGSAGIAGDMFLGALVDLGVSPGDLRAGLSALGLPGWSLAADGVTRHGLRATRVRVETDGGHEDHLADRDHGHGGTSWHEIESLLGRAELPARVRERSLGAFRRLCEVEAHLHGTTLEEVHLHEVGATDAVIDIVGACLGIELLGAPRVTCSPPELGSGVVRCAHGTLPVPAPATLALLAGRPVTSRGPEGELTTPTGAALLAELSSAWGPLPAMVVERVGYGAGTRELPDRPNVVRLTLGTALAEASPASRHVEIVADLDDADPETLASAAERLREAGALDVVLAPTIMKKGRPGIRLGVLAEAGAREALVDLLLAETTTIGCRWHAVERAECERTFLTVDTPHGPIRAKLATWRGRLVTAKPEHEDCAAAARRTGVPIKTVVADAMAAVAQASRKASS